MPSKVQAFVDEVKNIFQSMDPGLRQCLMKQTVGKMMGQSCPFDDQTQREMVFPQGPHILQVGFSQFIQSANLNLAKIQETMYEYSYMIM